MKKVSGIVTAITLLAMPILPVSVAYAACAGVAAPIAVNGLSLNLPPSLSVSVPYADALSFQPAAPTDCSNVLFTLRDSAGKVSQSATQGSVALEFTCADANQTRLIQVEVCTQAACDYALTYAEITDTNSVCSGQPITPTIDPFPPVSTPYPAATPTPGPLFDGLVSCWNLNETSGTRADSVGSNHLTDNNTVDFAAGKIGNAASFVGANNESLSGTGASDIDMSQGMTVSYWKKNAGPADYGDVRIGSDVLSDGGGFVIGTNGSLINATFVLSAEDMDSGYPPSPYTQAHGTAENGDWQHIVAWYDSVDNKTHVTVDGVAELSSFGALAADPVFTSNEFVLGRAWLSPVTGLMDEVGVWNRVLTTAERATLYNGGAGTACPSGPTPSPTPAGDYRDILTFTLQTVGNGPASFDPIQTQELRVFNADDSAFTAAYGAGFSQWKTKLNLIYNGGVAQISFCTTDNDGACTAFKAAAGNYLVVGRYPDSATDKTVYVSKQEAIADFSAEKEAFADLKIIKHFKKGAFDSYGPTGQVVVVDGVPAVASSNSKTIGISAAAILATVLLGVGIYRRVSTRQTALRPPPQSSK